MHRRCAVLIMNWEILQSGDLAAKIRAGRVGEPSAEVTRGVAESLWEAGRSRIEENARAFAGARAKDHHAPCGVLFLAGFLVDEVNASSAALRVESYLAHHG